MNQSCTCRLVTGAIFLAALIGLFTASPAHAQEDARRATPPPGKALVFVFRSEREPIAAQVPVFVNTDLVGELANGTFTIATVSPGRTYVRVGDRVLSTLTIEAAPGQSYFVWVEAITGLPQVRTEVHLVTESDGRRSIAQSRLAGVAPAATATAPRLQPPPAPKPAAPRPQPPPAEIVAAPPAQQPSEVAKPAPTPPAAAREAPAVTDARRDREFALIASAGTFKMADGSQVVGGLASTFDTDSKSVFGVEAEWRNRSGTAFGGEVFYYKNNLVATGIPNGQQEVYAIMVNGKHYFRASQRIHPFVGAGVGATHAAYSGGFTGNATGAAFQGLVGAEFRFDSIGLHVRYKYLASKTGATGNQVKVGGSGILAGVSITF